MPVVKGTKDFKKRQQITVLKAGHPATFTKVRCPHCKLGYAVASTSNPSQYRCLRCSSTFSMATM